MSTRKTSPPEEPKATAAQKKETAKAPEGKNDNPQADGSKKPLNRKPSPRNGNILPEGKLFKRGEEQREIARRAGKKSVEVRRARKTFREEMLELLQIEAKDAKGKPHTQQEMILAAMIKSALNGNVKAYDSIRDTVGEKQQEQIKVAVSLPQFDNLDAAFASMAGDDP